MEDCDPGWYDPDGYYRLVVRPLRHQPDAVPDDLAVRYAMPSAPSELPASWLAAHLDTVVADWTSRVEPTREGAVYAALLRAHRELSATGDLTDPAWWADRAGCGPAEPPVPSPPPGRSPAALPAAAPVAVPRPTAPPVVTVPETSTEAEPDQLRPSARRVGKSVELRWTWPPWATETDLAWDGRRLRVSRHTYQHNGWWRLDVDPYEVDVEITAREGGGPGGRRIHGRVTAPACRQEVHYSVRRRGLLPGGRTYRLSFTTDTPPLEDCRVSIGWSTDRVLPSAPADVTVDGEPRNIFETSSQVDVTVPRDARWLRCFLVAGQDVVDLKDPDVNQLRLRP